MKNNLISHFLVGIYLCFICTIGCTDTTTKNKTDKKTNQATKSPTSQVISNKKTMGSLADMPIKKSLIVSEMRNFSDTKRLDKFTLKQAAYTNFVDDDFIFSIISHNGKELYKATFKGADLIDFGINDYAENGQVSIELKQKYIAKRVLTFFEDKNFMNPAIKPEETLEPSYSDEKIWKDIKANKNAIGFYYLLGASDGRSIAYSKSKQKAVVYFNCC